MRVVVCVLALVLAGCAGGGGSTEEDGFEDVPVEVDDVTGAIRGVVVDQSIVPVEGATVRVVGTDKEATTDAQGRFAFSKLPPGFYLINASKPLYRSSEVQEEVQAGEAQPRVLRMQMVQLYSGKPYTVPFSAEGYFTCSQAGVPGYGYGSSPCHSTTTIDLSDYGIVLEQNRDFHADVPAGWQTLVFEMTWEASTYGTSERMGLVVSTYKPERPTNHWFANQEADNPMRFQLDAGVAHPSAQQGSGDHEAVPEDGLEQMSFFASVRRPGDCYVVACMPGIAYEQDFYVFLHQFVYLPAPPDWSIVAGDSLPY